MSSSAMTLKNKGNHGQKFNLNIKRANIFKFNSMG